MLFVYGSLRTGAGGPMHATLAAAARSLGGARARGRLFAVDWYPGLVLDDHAWVRGELWALRDLAVLAELDDYEGSGFTRTRTLVHPDEGSPHEAWIYAYVGATEGLRMVESGDWLSAATWARATRAPC